MERSIESIESDNLDDGFHHLDPRKITLDRTIGLIVFVILTFAILAGLGIALLAAGANYAWWICCGMGVSAIAVLFYCTVVWPSVDFRYATWKLDDTGLEIRRGVLWRHQIFIPVARVQHVDVAQGPMQRTFGLANLVINTAGTNNSAVVVSGVSHETANSLRDQLVAQREAIDVV